MPHISATPFERRARRPVRRSRPLVARRPTGRRTPTTCLTLPVPSAPAARDPRPARAGRRPTAPGRRVERAGRSHRRRRDRAGRRRRLTPWARPAPKPPCTRPATPPDATRGRTRRRRSGEQAHRRGTRGTGSGPVLARAAPRAGVELLAPGAVPDREEDHVRSLPGDRRGRVEKHVVGLLGPEVGDRGDDGRRRRRCAVRTARSSGCPQRSALRPGRCRASAPRGGPAMALAPTPPRHVRQRTARGQGGTSPRSTSGWPARSSPRCCARCRRSRDHLASTAAQVAPWRRVAASGRAPRRSASSGQAPAAASASGSAAEPDASRSHSTPTLSSSSTTESGRWTRYATRYSKRSRSPDRAWCTRRRSMPPGPRPFTSQSTRIGSIASPHPSRPSQLRRHCSCPSGRSILPCGPPVRVALGRIARAGRSGLAPDTLQHRGQTRGVGPLSRWSIRFDDDRARRPRPTRAPGAAAHLLGSAARSRGLRPPARRAVRATGRSRDISRSRHPTVPPTSPSSSHCTDVSTHGPSSASSVSPGRMTW